MKLEKFIQTFESSIESQSNPKLCWKSYDEISKITNLDFHSIYNIINSCNYFCENNNGELTTRKLYEKYVPFFVKLKHTIQNRID